MRDCGTWLTNRKLEVKGFHSELPERRMRYPKAGNINNTHFLGDLSRFSLLFQQSFQSQLVHIWQFIKKFQLHIR